MSKVIEDAAQDFAAINEDKASNSAHSYSKYDIADAYQQGAEFGYELAENRIKKEYEEKLRWIPVEENLPEIGERVLLKNEFYEYVGFLSKNKKDFRALTVEISYSNEKIKGVTHWRYFL